MSACSRLQPPCNGSTGQVPPTELLKTIAIHRNTTFIFWRGAPQPGLSWLGSQTLSWPGALTRCARWPSYRPIQEAGRSVSGADVQRPWDQACGAYVAEWPTERPHGCFVGSCGAPSVPAHPTFGTAGSVPSAACAGSAMEDAGAENTWQEDMDMPDALQQRVLWCTRSRTVFWNLLTLCSPCAALTTRSCRRVCSTESRGMRLTVLRSTSSTSI